MQTRVQCVEVANRLEAAGAILPDGMTEGQRMPVLMRMPEHQGLEGLEVVGMEMEGPIPSRIEEATVHVVVGPRGIVNAISGMIQCVWKFFEQ